MAQNLQQLADGSAVFRTSEGKNSLEIGSGQGTVGTTSGLSITSELKGAIHKTVIALNAVSVTITDNGTAGGQGSVKLYDFPEGLITFLGATANVAITESGGVNNTAAVLAAIGSAAVGAGDATLSSTEADMIPSTSCTLTSSLGTFAGKSTTALLATFDGTATALDAYLNFAVSDASTTANATLSLTGSVTLVWVNCGDV